MKTAQQYLDRRWTALILLCVAQFIVVLDASIVNVALPSIGKGLHFSEQDLPWVVNAYVIAFGGFLLLGGACSWPAWWSWRSPRSRRGSPPTRLS